MAPKLSGGIDHVHVYVGDRSAAARWYERVLGFRPASALLAWAEDPRGPLTLEDPAGKVHLALFETGKGVTDTIAFGASGDEFLEWKSHLESLAIELRVADHTQAFSLYFRDPDGNVHEITTYDAAHVRRSLG